MSKTSLKPTLIVSVLYAIWAWSAPTAVGPGGYIIWTPVIAIAVYFVHSMFRFMMR